MNLSIGYFWNRITADLADSTSLLLCSLFSLPVSTTHAKTTSIMGVGAVKRISPINFSVVRKMVLTGVLHLVFRFPPINKKIRCGESFW